MTYEYELYERRADGVLNWRGVVRGLDGARVTLQLLCDDTGNECFAVQSATRQRCLIRIPEQDAPRAFQIAYGPKIHARAEMLHRRGYDVTAVWGNAAALLILADRPHYDVFVIAEEATVATRAEMLHWLQQRYRRAGILALGSSTPSSADPPADAYLRGEASEAWLSRLGTQRVQSEYRH